MDRTIVNPEPFLALPKKLYVNTRGPSGAAVYLRYTWRFFAKLLGARDIIADFLYPNHPEGMYLLPTYFKIVQTLFGKKF